MCTVGLYNFVFTICIFINAVPSDPELDRGLHMHLQDPVEDNNSDQITIPIPSISGDSPSQLPSCLRRKLPTPSIADSENLIMDLVQSDNDFFMDVTPSVEGEAEHKQPERAVPGSKDDDVKDEDWDAGTQTSVFVPDDDSSDTDYQPTKAKKPANIIAKGPRSKVNNAPTRKSLPVDKPPAKAPAAKARPRKSTVDPRPGASATHQKPKANDKKKPSAVENHQDVKEKGQESIAEASASGAQSHSRSTTRNKGTQKLPKAVPSAYWSGATTQPKQKPPVKRVAKKPFYPALLPQASQKNSEAADDPFELIPSSPEPLVKDIPARPKTSKAGKASEMTEKKKPVPEEVSSKMATTQKITKPATRASQSTVPEAIASVGPNSKKKRGPVVYGSKSKASKRNTNSWLMADGDDNLVKSGSSEERQTRVDSIEKKKQSSRRPPLTKPDSPSISEDDIMAEESPRDNHDSPVPIVEDVQLPDEPMIDNSDFGNDTNVPIDISSDRTSEMSDTEEPAPSHHLKIDEVAKPRLVSAPIGIQHLESKKAEDIPDIMKDRRHAVQLKNDPEGHQGPLVLTTEHPVDQTQHKRKMTENETGNSSKRAKTDLPIEPLSQQVTARHMNTSIKPASPEPQHTYQALSPRGDALRFANNTSIRIEPKVVATEQPEFDYKGDEKRRGLFTIHEDRSGEIRVPSSRFEERFSAGQGGVRISLPKVTRSTVTSSLVRDLGSPIQTQVRRDNSMSTLHGKVPSTRTPLNDIRHIPINGHGTSQEAGTSSMDRSTTISTSAFRPRDRREMTTGADRLSHTLHNIVDVSVKFN